VTQSPPLRLDQPNGYTECEEALKGTMEWKTHAENLSFDMNDMNEMKRTAKHVIGCFECRIGSKSKRIEQEYKCSKKMQAELAFVLRDLDKNYVKKYLNEARGFDRVQPIKEVLVYKDIKSYFKCHAVVEQNKKKHCFYELRHYHEGRKGHEDQEMRKTRQQILETLQSKMSCKCDHTDDSQRNSFTCSSGHKVQPGKCAQDHVCNKDLFVLKFGLDPNMDEAKREHCKPAKKCNEENLAHLCGNIYFFPNPTTTHAVCLREHSCSRDECCTNQRQFQLFSGRKGEKNKRMCMSESRRRTDVDMRPCNKEKSEQHWKWKDGATAGGYHMLLNPATNQCLQAEGGDEYVILRDCRKGSVKQQWKYVRGSKTIFNPHYGQVLDVQGAEQYVEEGNYLITYHDNKAANYGYTAHQQWNFKPWNDIALSGKFQEGVVVDMRAGLSTSLAGATTFAVFAVLLVARALRKERNCHQDMEDSETLLS